MYVFNPELRWTTDYHTCGYSPRCLDFESLALHELGHYLGITHQRKPSSVMAAGYEGRNKIMGQCEANAVRRLYSPQILNQTPIPPPDNSPCEGTTAVGENPAVQTPAGTKVQVYPQPVTDGRLSVHLRLERSARVTLSILDVTGRTLLPLSDTYQQAGEQDYAFTVNLASGVYFLRVDTGGTGSVHNITVLK